MDKKKADIKATIALSKKLEAANEKLHIANQELLLANQSLEQTTISLKKSEEKFRLIFHQAPLGIFHFNSEGIITECNDIFVGIIGSSREALIGLNMLMLPDQRVVKALKEAITKQKSTFIEIEYKSFTADKTTPTRILFAPVKNDTSKFATEGIGIVEDITERVQTQLELQKNMDRLQLAMDAADHAFWDVDLITGEAYFSPMFFTMLGYEMGEFPSTIEFGKSLIHPDDRENIILRIREAFKKNRFFEEQYRMKCKDGTWKWINGRGKVFKANNTEIPTKATGINEDITEKVEAKKALIASENRFRNLIDFAVDGIIAGSEEGVITRINKRLIEITGKAEDEFIGLHISQIFPQEELEKNPLNFSLLKKGATIITNRKIIRPDGKEIFVEMHSKRMPDKTYQSIIRDVTERKLKESELAAEKEQLSITLTSIGDAVITTDIYFNIVIMNRVAEELTGWTADEARGKHLPQVLHITGETTMGNRPNPAKRALTYKDINELPENAILVSKNNTKRLVTYSIAPIKDSSDKITGVILVLKDITEKQKLLESVLNSQKLESLGILAGGIAHDFNNLLGGILSNIDLARIKNCDENIYPYLEKAVNSIERARGLTRQLLTFASGGDPTKKVLELFPFIQDTVLFALSGSNISCEFNIDKNLWQSNIDKAQIAQVIDNIVINAIQAMPGGGSLHLVATNISSWTPHNSSKKNDFVKISISDTGTGIPEKIIKHIFNPFFTTKTKGHGLGLATSYSIISRHGGYLEIDSKENQGSTFHIYLPAIKNNTDSQHNTIKAVTHIGEGTILIMDDDETIRDILSAMLEHLGYSTVLTKDGDEALTAFSQNAMSDRPFKAIILDLTVPGGMGGEQTIKEIRKLDNTIPVFVSSGYSEDPIISRPEDFGFTASIRKPFQIKELSEMLQLHLK